MVNYQNGKIYVIKSYQCDMVYIGSTTQSLSMRMGGHRATYKHYLKTGIKRHMTSSHHILKYDDNYIELVEKYPCNDREELLKREGEIVKETKNCVNKRIDGRSYAQYIIDTKDYQIERRRRYYLENKEELTAKNKEYYEKNKKMILKQQSKQTFCECGGHYVLNHKARHLRTLKHREYLFDSHNIFNHL